MEQKINRLGTVLKNALYILGVLGTMCFSIWTTIDLTLDKKLEEYSMGLNQRVENLELYVSGQASDDLESTYERIRGAGDNGIADITKARCERVIRNYHLIQNPTEVQVLAFEGVRAYYERVFG